MPYPFKSLAETLKDTVLSLGCRVFGLSGSRVRLHVLRGGGQDSECTCNFWGLGLRALLYGIHGRKSRFLQGAAHGRLSSIELHMAP